MLKHLIPLFDSEDIIFVSDNRRLIHWLQNLNIRCSHIANVKKLPNNVVSIQSNTYHFNKVTTLLEGSDASVLTVPQVAFDTSFEVLQYNCKKLLETNFSRAFEKKNSVLSFLETSDRSIFNFCSDKANIQCEFMEHAEFQYPTSIRLTKNEPTSFAEFLELTFEHIHPRQPRPFVLSGHFAVSSILYAFTPGIIMHSHRELRAKAQKLFRQVSSSTKKEIAFRNNKISSFQIDGKEFLANLCELTGHCRNNEITEFAFGLNQDILHTINWSMNAQINEGASGIHIGIGDGVTGAHIDFICVDVNV